MRSATSRKITGSIPDKIIEFNLIYLIIPAVSLPLGLPSDRIECMKKFLGGG
jgi:hypothetical protein